MIDTTKTDDNWGAEAMRLLLIMADACNKLTAGAVASGDVYTFNAAASAKKHAVNAIFEMERRSHLMKTGFDKGPFNPVEYGIVDKRCPCEGCEVRRRDYELIRQGRTGSDGAAPLKASR